MSMFYSIITGATREINKNDRQDPKCYETIFSSFVSVGVSSFRAIVKRTRHFSLRWESETNTRKSTVVIVKIASITRSRTTARDNENLRPCSKTEKSLYAPGAFVNATLEMLRGATIK